MRRRRCRFNFTGMLHQPIRIKDHNDVTVTQNGIAREDLNVTQQRRHRFNHDFFCVEHMINDHAKGGASRLDNDDEVTTIGTNFIFAQMQCFTQRYQRQKTITQP